MAIVAAMVVQRTERGDLMFLTSATAPRTARPRRRRARVAARRRMTDLLVLCTGNAARSVIAGFMLDYLRDGRPGDPLHIVTAGTHTIDGQPMGMRTRAALSRLPELAGADFRRHRSRQVHGVDLVHAELVVVMEADHVRFVRRQFPDAAAKTAMIRHLCRVLAPAAAGPPRAGGGARPRRGRRSPTARTSWTPPVTKPTSTRRASTSSGGCAGPWSPCSRFRRPGRVAQSACTDRSPAHARSAMRRASFFASSSTAASESGRCAMKRRLAPSAMPTIP